FLEEPDPETTLRDITPASVLVPEQDGRRPVAGKYQDALLEAGIDPGEVVQVSGPLTIPVHDEMVQTVACHHLTRGAQSLPVALERDLRSTVRHRDARLRNGLNPGHDNPFDVHQIHRA